jgi:outer membrane lipoprotein LolB
MNGAPTVPGRRRGLALLPGLMALALAGCASAPTRPTDDDPAARHYRGRLAVRVAGDESRSFSAGFELHGTPDRGRIALDSPLGLRLGEAAWRADRATLHAPDGTREFDSLESLSEELFGDSIPIEALFDWLAGHPYPEVASRPLDSTTDTGFRQLGWDVRTTRLAADGLLIAERRTPAPVVTVRIKLDTP